MTALYTLTKELAEINDQLINAEGEISPELETRLDAVNLAVEQKSQGIRKWIAVIEGDTTVIDFEMKRLEKMKKIQDNLYERLKAYVKKNMEIANLNTIKTPIGTFTIAKNPDSIEIVVPELIPDKFKKVIPEQKIPDKAAIKEAMQEGYDVPGAKLITDKTNLRIK